MSNARTASVTGISGGLPSHRTYILGAAGIGLVFLTLASFLPTPPPGTGTASAGQSFYLSARLFGHRDDVFPPYPFTFHNLEWILFFIGAGELLYLYSRSRLERRQLDLEVLPADEGTLLDKRGLGLIAKSIPAASRNYRLQRLILRVVWQFQSSGSIGQATSVMNSSLELSQHSLDLEYSLSRYLAWLIPTIGFIGTALGIGQGLLKVKLGLPDDQIAAMFDSVTRELGSGFDTTLVALVLSSVLMFFLQRVQQYDEHALNLAGQYCLDRLINRFIEA